MIVSIAGQAPPPRTPRRELARVREELAATRSQAHARMEEELLRACGEKGYRAVSVRDVIERSGGHRVQFYERFASKADCYASAYAVHAERLCEEVLGAGAAERHWRDGLVAALRALGRLINEDPALARGVVVEVHVAGEPALVRRKELCERLSRAIDGARRETGSRHSPPPETAAFMIGAVETAVFSALVKGQPESFAAEAAPELAWMISAAYFDEAAAAADRARLGG